MAISEPFEKGENWWQKTLWPGFQAPLSVNPRTGFAKNGATLPVGWYGLGVRKAFRIAGIVQGVGFRPWVHQLAQRFGLAGWVLNTGLGVTVEVEGSDHSLLCFGEELRRHPPALAVIDEIAEEILEPVGYQGFRIRETDRSGDAFVLVPADVAVCPDCAADFGDPSNRRYGYPFTNCTNCGPRYSLIVDVPYDRKFTTMAGFPMCAACELEYHDPSDRRFHAQPNACPDCGPWVELWNHDHRAATGVAAIAETRRWLEAGRIVAVKGIGGFHLACDAGNTASVATLRERKRRSGKPFAVMARNMDVVRELCHVSAEEEKALRSVRSPIVLLDRKRDAPVSDHVAPGVPTLGVMLPYSPLHHLLFDGACYRALVMTSGNVSEEPIASRNDEVSQRLGGLADGALIHNRGIHRSVDDSVVRVWSGKERVLRRSRGYAPLPVDLGIPLVEVAAYGAELKNTLCLTKDHYAILSQHIGDLENLETVAVFEATLEQMKRFFRVRPRMVAYDLHPGYISTRLALQQTEVTLTGVQHHHAHIASCMAEHRLTGTVIGIALDGTGYGTDGKIWGGEVLVCDYLSFERRGHLRYVGMAGGDAAVREPWRMALSYLRDAGLTPPETLSAVPGRSLALVNRMLERGLHTVETSSCGRLFDAVAAILGIRLAVTYEGQAAIELEAVARAGVDDGYDFSLDEGVIDLRESIRGVVRDRADPPLAAARFHNTLARAITESCLRLRKAEGLNRVCLSGGTFQNVYLLEKVTTALQASGFEVYTHVRVPANDGGIALGQAVVGNARFTLV